jgi:phosphoribosylamine--glycine ligase
LPDDAVLYHAGTTRDLAGVLRTNGGRVLCATGFGATVAAAAEASRRLADQVRFEGKVLQRDIGWREVARAG